MEASVHTHSRGDDTPPHTCAHAPPLGRGTSTHAHTHFHTRASVRPHFLSISQALPHAGPRPVLPVHSDLQVQDVLLQVGSTATDLDLDPRSILFFTSQPEAISPTRPTGDRLPHSLHMLPHSLRHADRLALPRRGRSSLKHARSLSTHTPPLTPLHTLHTSVLRPHSTPPAGVRWLVVMGQLCRHGGTIVDQISDQISLDQIQQQDGGSTMGGGGTTTSSGLGSTTLTGLMALGGGGGGGGGKAAGCR